MTDQINQLFTARRQVLPPPAHAPRRAPRPALDDHHHQALLETAVSDYMPRPRALPDLDQRQQVAIMTAALLGSSLAEFSVVETFGRVAVVDVTLPRRSDPRLCLALVDVGAPDLDRLRRGYTAVYDALLALLDGGAGDWFYYECERSLMAVANILRHHLTAGEFEYWRRWWALCLALPAECQPEMTRGRLARR